MLHCLPLLIPRKSPRAHHLVGSRLFLELEFDDIGRLGLLADVVILEEFADDDLVLFAAADGVVVERDAILRDLLGKRVYRLFLFAEQTGNLSFF